MLVALYLRYSDIYERKVSFQTLKKKLRGLRRSSVVSNLAVMNNLFTHSMFMGKYEEELPKIEKELKEYYLRETIRSDISSKKLHDRLVFTRLQTLFLAQLSILYSNDDVMALADGATEAGFDLGECCLIASDYLLSPKEEKNSGVGSDRKKVRHLGFQLAPSMELTNPLDIILGVVRSDIIYSKILNSDEFKQTLAEEGLSHFDIGSEFEKATEISLQEYIDITVGLLSFFLSPEDKSIRTCQFFTTDGFLRLSQLSKEKFNRYLNLESQTPDQYKKSFQKQHRYLTQFSFLPFKRFPIMQIHDGVYICADTFFLSEKLNSGIYWKILDKLPADKKDTFFAVFGHLFESYVRRILKTVCATVSDPKNILNNNGLLLSSPKYQNGDKCFDEIIYYPKTKHLIVIESKSSFLHSEAKYGRSVRSFIREVAGKFVESEDGDKKGVGQLANHIGKLFCKDKDIRLHLANTEFDAWIQTVEKISPVLISQEPLISFHINEDFLNGEFNKLKAKFKKKYAIKDSAQMSQLTVLDIETLEMLKPHFIAGELTLEQCINSRNHRDPNYKWLFRTFVNDNFKLRQKSDAETDKIYAEVFDRAKELFFGPAEIVNTTRAG